MNSNTGSQTRTDLDNLLAQQRDLRQTIAQHEAMIAAIKSSSTYRVVQLVRRLVPKAPPPFTEPHTSAAAGRGAADAQDAPLAEAWAELSRLERDARRTSHELHHLQLSRPLRWWRAARRRLSYLRHPVFAVRITGRALANTKGSLFVGRAWRRFRWHELHLRHVPPSGQRTVLADAEDAARWLPPVRIGGETQHALLMRPATEVTYQVTVPTGARLSADCAVLPSAWDHHGGPITFTLQVTPSSGAAADRSVTLSPQTRGTDRCWHRLEIDVPGSGDLTVRLVTALPPGVSPERALAVWGEPRAVWARRQGELRRSLVVLGRRLRDNGLRATLRHISGVQAADEHAMQYRAWMAEHTPTAEQLPAMTAAAPGLAYRPLISVLTPVYNTRPAWLRACIDSVRHQAYPYWQLCLADDGSTNRGTLAVLDECAGDDRITVTRLGGNRGIAAATDAALAAARGEFIALLDHDDVLAPQALFEMASALQQQPDLDFIYSDEDKLDEAGERCEPYFKPDWSPEHFRSCMYTCHLMLLRASLVREAGGFRPGFDGSQDYDLVLRIVERTGRIHHIPQILYHWRKSEGSAASSGTAKNWAIDAGERALADHLQRAGFDAVVLRGPLPGLYRIRHRIRNRPLVSIILPTAGGTRDLGHRVVDLIPNCVGSVVSKTTYDNYEIVIGDDGPLPEHVEAFLATVPVPVTRVSFPPLADGFNYGRKLNFIARHARGEHFLLFNDDTEVISGEWMEAMLEFSQQEEIGAVGAKLWFGDGRLQHIGMVLGVNGMVAHAFHGHAGTSPGYGGSAHIIRNYSAVTGACLMTRKALFDRFGGFDERFKLDFNDVNYCLKVRAAGYRVVFTPFAQLYHLEMSSSGTRPWNPDEVNYMVRTWGDVHARDPYYNPNLTRDYCDYRVRL